MAKLPINISLITNNRNGLSSAINVNLSNNGNVKSYLSLVDAQTNSSIGVSVASGKDWSNAWKEQQRALEGRNRQREDHTDPTPLLIDAISSLPPNSSRRRSYENLKSTIDGTASNVGNGLDTMTRESYRDLKRLGRQSEMIQLGMNEPLPEASQLLGSEEGQFASNIQDWKPAVANAGKPVSDALGSHIDTDSSIAKDSSGPSAFLPSSASSLIDGVSPQLANEVEGGYKKNQLELMQHLPSKIAGNLRQLSTALDSVLSVPFEIASDVYNGLRQLMTQLSDLIDGIKAKVTKWFLGAIGGLVDGLFPEGMLDGFISAISSIADEFGDLFDLLGGFPIVSSIRDIMSNIISGNFMAAFGNIAKLGSLLMSGLGAGGVLGGFAGSSVNCIENQIGLGKASKSFKSLNKAVVTGVAVAGILGALPGIAKGLGNLGSVIGKGISSGFGFSLSNIRNLGGIIAGILPMGLGFILGKMFGKLCSVGITGNGGFSIGSIFDGSRDRTFDKYMNHFAAHSSIVSPLFNKQSKATGSYAAEDQMISFENSQFVPGSQTAKGVTVVGPGGSTAFKPFPAAQSSRRSQPSSFNSFLTNSVQGSQLVVSF